MTELQDRIVAELQAGAATSAELASRLGVTVRAISNSASFLRGHGKINDGSILYEWPSPSGMVCMHRPDGLVTWSLGDTPVVHGKCPERITT